MNLDHKVTWHHAGQLVILDLATVLRRHCAANPHEVFLMDLPSLAEAASPSARSRAYTPLSRRAFAQHQVARNRTRAAILRRGQGFLLSLMEPQP